jgi:Secretion system C-terminal sorting domain
MRFAAKYLATTLLMLLASGVYAQTIITIAGDSITQYIGDGHPATNFSLARPMSICSDKKGNLFIADYFNNRIRKLAHDTISTVVGNDTPGYSGDGGLAALAKLNNPDGIYLDTAGNFFITDMHNEVVRKVDVHTLIITTVCGSGSAGFAGDGAAATTAKVATPGGAIVDSAGNIYIPDYGNHRIRRVAAATGIISTYAGTGTPGYAGDNGPASVAQLNYPNSMCIDRSGNLYFTEFGNHTVRKIDLTGTITTVAGNTTQGYTGDGSLAVNAELNQPNAVFVDKRGYMYISDNGNNVVRAVTPTGIIKTIAGTGLPGYSGDGGPAISATFRGLTAVFVNDSGYIFIADGDNSVIRKVTPLWYINGVKDLAPISLSIFPNPTTGKFTIKTGEQTNDASIEFFNTIGQSIYHSPLSGTETDIDLTGYPRGMYYLQMVSPQGRNVQKIVLR